MHTDHEDGSVGRSVVLYDEAGMRMRHEFTRDGERFRTIVYRHDARGDVLERVNMEPDDLDRFEYRVRPDGRIAMRLDDRDNDGRFGGYVRYVHDASGRAVRREYYKLDGERDREELTYEARVGTLRNVSTYRYRRGRLHVMENDRGADGDIDSSWRYRYEPDGRIREMVVERAGKVASTTRFVYERGPCSHRSLIPESQPMCVAP